MTVHKPGQFVDEAPHITHIDFSQFHMRVPTHRYYSEDYARRERVRVWMRTWQFVGRSDDIPEPGDFMEYRLFDQSYVLVRGRDSRIRGFVNACRHRGNAFCTGKGKAARFTCPYHNWSYGLDGRLLAVARPDFQGTLEEFVGSKEELGLIEVPVDQFAGFIFLNPDAQAASLADYLGQTAEYLAPYHIDEMIPFGLNVREEIACNWKVIMDAFQEGYHIQGVHPELIPAMDEAKERYRFFGDHSVATAPFGASNLADADEELQLDAIRGLPATFPGLANVMPRFDALVSAHRGQDDVVALPNGQTPRLLLQEAMRHVLTERGLDVAGLTDSQLSDNQFWILFPNFFMTIHAGEATVIVAQPHATGDPNRCFWHVMNLQWFPPEERATRREPVTEVAAGDHFDYFLALEQDFEQMERQQRGLRQNSLPYLSLTKQEVRLAHFHAALDGWVEPDEQP